MFQKCEIDLKSRSVDLENSSVVLTLLREAFTTSKDGIQNLNLGNLSGADEDLTQFCILF
eukprot:TRINITY_DN9352_c0_g1_i1.p3 TRINITY_DN9352_c0_g1~~TRINITY_DN9352_c0_g1_i1.p3  ORF type:complete len:60 (-),score=4.53 TRINITY_DN9352_c0_g1_i1:63-242(-)